MLDWSFCPPFCIPALTRVTPSQRQQEGLAALQPHQRLTLGKAQGTECWRHSGVTHRLLLLENTKKSVSSGVTEPALTVTAQTCPAATAAARTSGCQVSFPKSILWAKGKGCVAMDSTIKLRWMATGLVFPLLLVKAHLFTWCLLLKSVLTIAYSRKHFLNNCPTSSFFLAGLSPVCNRLSLMFKKIIPEEPQFSHICCPLVDMLSFCNI